MTVGLLVTSLVLGLRHGVDWDHIAAIADLSGAADDRRRGFRLALLYAVGHAVVVFALGCLAIVAGSAIPESLDRWMGRIVGLTLIWLGIWVIVELVRHGRDFRLRSRWMLVLDGAFAGIRRVGRRADHRLIEIEHEHEHDHPDHGDHSSDHHHRHDAAVEPDGSPLAVSGAPAEPVPAGRVQRLLARRVRHSHVHRHTVQLPDRLDGGAGAGTGAGTAAGIGMLHGVGVESPTQIAVFVASTSVVGWSAGLAILLAWCVGLIIANSALAVLAGFGLLEARRNFTLYAVIAALVAVGSITMGVLYLFSFDVLPAITL